MTKTPVHPAIHSGYGLIEAPFDEVTSTFGAGERGDGSTMRVVGSSAGPADALDHLSLRTHPATRLALLDLGDWTGVLTNHRAGSDFADHQHWAGRATASRTIRVVDSEARWWQRGKRRERLAWEARIFELHGPDNAPIRSIACMNDGGRWTFTESGHPLPVETSAPYAAARVRDRFTREHLRDLLVALGPGPLTAERLLATRRFALLAERIANDAWRATVDEWARPLEEVDDPAFRYFMVGMTAYVPHIETHAASVIHSFERAIEINPDYEPRARGYLAEARRIAHPR